MQQRIRRSSTAQGRVIQNNKWFGLGVGGWDKAWYMVVDGSVAIN
jgi:hypothetical protein